MTEMITRSYEATEMTTLDGERSVVARWNASNIDEFGTVIDPAGADLNDFNNNPTILWSHGMESRGSVPVGRGWVKYRPTERDILGKCIFDKDEFSELLFQKYKSGSLRGWSIRMVPTLASPPTPDEIRANPALADCRMIYRKWKLKEVSAVAVPGNAECLTMLVSRGLWTPSESEKRFVSSEGGEYGKKPAEEPAAADDEPDTETQGEGEGNPEEAAHSVRPHKAEFHVMRNCRTMMCRHAELGDAMNCIRSGMPGKCFGTKTRGKPPVDLDNDEVSPYSVRPEGDDEYHVLDKKGVIECKHNAAEDAMRCIGNGTVGRCWKRSLDATPPPEFKRDVPMRFDVTSDGQTWYVKAPDGRIAFATQDADLANEMARELPRAKTFAAVYKESSDSTQTFQDELRQDVKDLLACMFDGKLSA
jgi:hypothetical protein